MKEYYQVYVKGQWHGDFETWEDAQSYVNSLGVVSDVEIIKR